MDEDQGEGGKGRPNGHHLISQYSPRNWPDTHTYIYLFIHLFVYLSFCYAHSSDQAFARAMMSNSVAVGAS